MWQGGGSSESGSDSTQAAGAVNLAWWGAPRAR